MSFFLHSHLRVFVLKKSFLFSEPTLGLYFKNCTLQEMTANIIAVTGTAKPDRFLLRNTPNSSLIDVDELRSLFFLRQTKSHPRATALLPRSISDIQIHNY